MALLQVDGVTVAEINSEAAEALTQTVRQFGVGYIERPTEIVLEAPRRNWRTSLIDLRIKFAKEHHK
jgi:hypothetical protein